MSHDLRDILGRLSAIEEGLDADQRRVKQLPALFQPKKISPVLDGPYGKRDAMDGYLVGEDLVSAEKKRLSDYLHDVAQAIEKDSDLVDTDSRGRDTVKSVKTIRTDDGHEIKIVGNEDDGFRVSIRDQQGHTRFSNLDEAVMACEMYCARRRQRRSSQDYIEEA
jgi:hypothetical protein